MKTDEEIKEASENSLKPFDTDPRSEKERELYAAQQRRVKVNQSRVIDIFDDSDAPEYTHITSQQVRENMKTTKIGQEYLKYTENLPERIKFDYFTPSEVYGEQRGASIVIYMRKCESVERVARTIIHECTHYRYGIGQSQWAESVCFAHELMHKYNRTTLTVAEKRRIIKAVKEGYDDMKWRKGGVPYMAEERVIEKLRRGEKVLCPVCKKHFFDNNIENLKTSNYFHCEDPDCKGYVHEQKVIDIE